MSGSSISRVISPREPAPQLTAEESPFSAVILCDKDNERYYDRAYESAQAQVLPFRSIRRLKLDEQLASTWDALARELSATWIIYFHADVVLMAGATLRVYPFLDDPTIGSFRVKATNRLLGKKFVNLFGSPDIGVCRVGAIRKAMAKTTGQIFDLQAPIVKAGYQVVLLRSRLRTSSGQPGAVGSDMTEVVTLGDNVAVWAPLYAYRWCRIFGAQARALGGSDYGVLAQSMIEGDHPQWQLGLAGFINGILSEDGPEIRSRMSVIRAEFERAAFLVKGA